MASVAVESNGRRRIRFIGVDGRPKEIRLGKVSDVAAMNVRAHVEELLSSRITGSPLERYTAEWVAAIGPKLYQRFERVGLVHLRAPEERVNVASEIKAEVEKTRVRLGEMIGTKTYIVEAVTTGMVKIGVTANIRDRMAALQTACPVALKLVKAFDGDCEKEWHNRWAHCRTQGEWFRPDREMLKAIGHRTQRRLTKSGHELWGDKPTKNVKGLIADLCEEIGGNYHGVLDGNIKGIGDGCELATLICDRMLSGDRTPHLADDRDGGEECECEECVAGDLGWAIEESRLDGIIVDQARACISIVTTQHGHPGWLKSQVEEIFSIFSYMDELNVLGVMVVMTGAHYAIDPFWEPAQALRRYYHEVGRVRKILR